MRAVAIAAAFMLKPAAAFAQASSANIVHCATQHQNSRELNVLDVSVNFKNTSPAEIEFSGRHTLPTSATDPRLQSFVASGSGPIQQMHAFTDAKELSINNMDSSFKY